MEHKKTPLKSANMAENTSRLIILLLLLTIYEFVNLILKYVIWDPGLGLISNENIVISRTILKIT